MTQPENDNRHTNAATSSPPPAPLIERLAARLSIIAALVCMAFNCVGNRILFQLPGHDRRLDFMLGSMSSVCVLLGIVLGVAGFVGGIRKKNADTVAIAMIGLLLNVGIVFVVVWMLAILWGKNIP